MNASSLPHFVLLQVPGGHGAELDPIQLILGASLVVKLVMALLAIMSLVSWFIMGSKFVQLSRATRASAKFLDTFWGDGQTTSSWTTERLEAVYGQLRALDASPLARVFHAGYVELARITGGADDTQPANAKHVVQTGDLDNVERALKRSGTNEITVLENALPFLATTGSVGPFVGLFGTVWGVMNSFIGIGNLGNASLAVVAPGIAEALIATAIGLAAAIPAVMAYNYFIRRIRVIESEIEAFGSDYLNIVRRHFLPN